MLHLENFKLQKMPESTYKKQRSIRHNKRPKKFMGYLKPRPTSDHAQISPVSIRSEQAPSAATSATTSTSVVSPHISVSTRSPAAPTPATATVSQQTPVSSRSEVAPSTSITPTPEVPIPVSTRSHKKIALSPDSFPEPSSDHIHDFHFIRMKSLMKALSNFSCCGSPLTVVEDRAQRRGFVSRIAICCTICGTESLITDPYCEEDLEVNSRSVLAMRLTGQGRAGLATFAGVMGMPPPVSASNFSVHNKKLRDATEKIKDANQSAAAKHLRKNVAEDEVVDVKVTLDGTWARRGHQSLYGVVVVASWETGQVLDTEVLSKYCHACNKKRNADTTSDEFLDWWEGHQAECSVNYSGSSGAMEVEGALRIWRRSVDKYKLRYTQIISDGDSKSFAAILKENPYGNEHPIVKFECVGHVQKRMYNRLKALKAKTNVDKNGRVVKIGGKGRITEEKMKLFQRYYGKAIRSNVNDSKAMKNAVLAIFYHSISTDSHPLHFHCPGGTTSWCKFQRAMAKKETPPKHNQSIPYEVAPFVKQVFLELSSDALMERCVLGATQNQNESFNSIIWNRCPKVGFCSCSVVEIAVN